MNTLKKLGLLFIVVFMFLIGLSSALDYFKSFYLASADMFSFAAAVSLLTLSISLGHAYFTSSFRRLINFAFLLFAASFFLGGIGLLYTLRQDYSIASLDANGNLLAVIAAVLFFSLSIHLGRNYFTDKRS